MGWAITYGIRVTLVSVLSIWGRVQLSLDKFQRDEANLSEDAESIEE